MRTKSFLLLASLVAALHGHATANEILYQAGFEPPVYSSALPLRGQDSWENWASRADEEITVSTENPRDGGQCLRWKGVAAPGGFSHATCFRSILDATAANPPLVVDISTDIRFDGPQTGTLGTPDQDILSANLFAVVLQPNGWGQHLGGFFVSSGGKIWTFGSRPEDRYLYSTPVKFGTYHSLRLRVNFFTRTLTYVVDGVELGSAPMDPSVLSERLVSGYLQVFGPDGSINTPELTYDRANYTAYFDNYSIESVPLTPADVAIQFAVTDFAVSETDGMANVSIIRRGYTDSAVSATFSTADGSAVAGQDYLSAATVVAFAPGEWEKVVQIPILNDALVEADEIVNLNLGAASPGVQLPRSWAPLWILDDERAGSADPGFQFNAPALGLTIVYEAPSIVPLPGKKFFACVAGLDQAGNFVTTLARFNADGAVDPSFAPYPLPYVGFPSQVTAINGGSRVLLNLGDRLTRLEAEGRRDSSFNVTTTFGPDPGFITDAVVQPDQKVVIAGFFDAVNGVSRGNVARVSAIGEVDASFDPGAGPDDAVIDVALQPDGRILIGGYFQNVGGQPRPLLARLNANGSLDASFDPGESFGDSFYGFPTIQTIAVQADGRILVGGFFDSYQGAPRSSLVRLMPDGSLDTSFDVGAGFESGFFPGPGFVSGLALQPDGKVLVSGSFGYFNGTWATGIVRLNPDGLLDTAFQLGGTDSFAASLNAGPSLALLPDGDILALLSNNVSFIKNEPVQYQGLVRLNGGPFGKSKKIKH